jgi:hypothetical protein
MISAQTRFAFVARENRFPLFRILLWRRNSRLFQQNRLTVADQRDWSPEGLCLWRSDCEVLVLSFHKCSPEALGTAK